MSQLEPILDFVVLPTYDLRVLLVADTSQWKHIDEPSYIDIKTPGRKKAVTLRFEKGKVNIFNSSLLELTSTTSASSLTKLPDGLYHITLYACEGCKFRVEKYHLRTIHTQLELDCALIKLDLNGCAVDECYKQKIFKANRLLMSAHANARDGNYNEAVAEFDVAKELLQEVLDCDDCG